MSSFPVRPPYMNGLSRPPRRNRASPQPVDVAMGGEALTAPSSGRSSVAVTKGPDRTRGSVASSGPAGRRRAQEVGHQHQPEQFRPLGSERQMIRRSLPGAWKNVLPCGRPFQCRRNENCMAAKKLNYRLPVVTEDKLDNTQRALLESMRAGPRGDRIKLGGPFGVYLHAPQYGELTQQLGAFLRFKTSLEPRLSEFAILCTARLWRAQYEWHAHAPIAEKAGVRSEAIRDIKAGRTPKKAAKDERAIFDFVQELYKKRRVGERSYKRVQGFLGDRGIVELIGILGYYTGVSMVLNVFNVPLPDGAQPYFAEPK